MILRQWVGATTVVLASVSGGLLPVSAATIGVDAIHGYDNSSIFATGSDFDAFRESITDLGHTIVPMTSFEAEDLAGLDALMISIAYSQNGADYSNGEMAAIQGFVNANGGLLVAGDNGTGFRVANLNELVALFGITYADEGTEGNGHTIENFVPHPVTDDLESFGIDFQLRITTGPPSLDLTIGSGPDDALSVLENGGRAVFVSDVSMWKDLDAGSDRDITFGDNQLLLENIVTYIVPEPASLALLGVAVLVLVRRRHC